MRGLLLTVAVAAFLAGRRRPPEVNDFDEAMAALARERAEMERRGLLTPGWRSKRTTDAAVMPRTDARRSLDSLNAMTAAMMQRASRRSRPLVIPTEGELRAFIETVPDETLRFTPMRIYLATIVPGHFPELVPLLRDRFASAGLV